MTTINTGIPLNQPGAKPLDMSKVKFVELSEEQKARLQEALAKAPEQKLVHIAEVPAVEQLQRNEQAHTEFKAQEIAQEAAAEAAPVEEENSTQSAAVSEFLEYMSLTPEEQMFESMLKELGLTREEFDALPPEEQEEIAEEIRQRIREKIEQGLLPA